MDDHIPHIIVTFSNGVEEIIDESKNDSQFICKTILEKGQTLETQKMFKEFVKSWPIVILGEDLHQIGKPTKVRV